MMGHESVGPWKRLLARGGATGIKQCSIFLLEARAMELSDVARREPKRKRGPATRKGEGRRGNSRPVTLGRPEAVVNYAWAE
jgi:hypothetical protein